MPPPALMVIVAIAFVVEAAIGFGATVVTVALGALFVPVKAILPAFVPLNLVMSTYLVSRYHAAIDRRLLLRLVLPLMLLGLPVGMFGARELPTRALMLALGAFVVTLSVSELWRLTRGASAARAHLARGPRVALLVLAGTIHGAFATGGPLVVYVIGRELTDKAAFRATLSLLWLVLNLVLLGGFIMSGQLDAATITQTAWLALPLGLGIVLGERLHHRIPERQFRFAMFTLLSVAGVLLMLRN